MPRRRYRVARMRRWLDTTARPDAAGAAPVAARAPGQPDHGVLALVSHELRTPLTAILGYVELTLADDGLGAEHARQLRVVERHARRLLRLVDDLLLSARIADGEPLPIARDAVDLTGLARDAVELARPRAAEAQVKLTAAPAPPAVCRGDRDRLAQVLDNLIANALAFTPPGGAVTVRTAVAGDSARVEVADTGIGIQPRDLPHLFDRFYRAPEAARGPAPGLGLGLAVVRAIVAGHGGDVTVASEPGCGATFTVTLPRDVADRATDAG